MLYGIDENSIIKYFTIACFLAAAILFFFTLIVEITGGNGLFLVYRGFEFALYGIFALGFYKIIKLLSQLIGEMKFFRNHYFLKNKEK